MSEPHRLSRYSRASAALFTATVLVGSGAAGVLLYRLLAPRATLYPMPGPAVPAPAQRTTEAESPRRLPAELPAISLPTVDGVTRSLSDWRGRPLLINFWATWCEPCRREVPLLETLRHERAAQGLEVVGIAVDSVDAVRQYVPSHGIDYPVLVGEQGGAAAALAFGAEPVLPFSVFADRRGEVVTLKVGELHRDEAELILDRIREVDAGTLDLAAARAGISAAIRSLSLARAAHSGGPGH
ncbi:MAG: TlpA family protein disulfide reductase [Gammaproteobacteria bacterium]|nr:TlpA family protein disulfide reductase [Gammaproteobacteria bacterium]